MSTVAGRKKSIISSAGPSIEVPVPNNTVLNKAASQSTSLYQQCSSLRTRLMRVQDFSDFFSLSSQPEASSSRRSTDPVTQLWDCFSLGVPLCYLFNLLPNVHRLDVDTASFDPTNDKTRKRAIAMFAMGLRQLEGCGTFTVTDLWDRASTDGFVKVVNIVTDVVDRLPEEAFSDALPASPQLFSPKDSSDSLPAELFASGSQEYPGSQVVMELLHTERKYVQDLETMQRYATAAAESNTIDQDTIHLLFPGLNKLLNFQRKFLIRLEGIWELPWNERQWGSPFIEFEEEFAVYEPYCANYTSASEIMLTEEHHLSALDHILNVKSELPAFLIKPVQRICKYPLLLESLVKVLNSKAEYSYLDELKLGVAAAKRITDRINEEQRRAENAATVKNLEGRVEDWKGHHISNFGALLVDDIFTVTKSEMDREYHVFLFEKIILCCKEYVPSGPNAKKVSKSNSILKKPGPPPPLSIPFGQSTGKKRNTPLLLKGRIFLNNVTSAVPKVNAGQYSLAVYWKGDDDLEYFTLRCRNEEQLRLWENQLNRLIQDVVARRNSEGRGANGQPMRFTHIPNSTSPAPPIGRQHQYGQDRTFSMFSQTTSASVPSSSLPSYPAPYSSRGGRYPTSATSEDPMSAHGPQGYPPYDGFDVDPEDDYEDYPVASSVPPSGRATPMGGRRHNLPDNYPGSRGVVSPQPPPGAYPSHSMANGRPGSTRSSQGPERPVLRSQFSSNRLRPDRPDSRASAHSPQPPPPFPSQRSRSASQPSAYVPRAAPPPLPTSMPWAERSQQQPGDSKRGSSSSQSTGDNSSDYSPNSGSPITPFGSSDSSLAGMAGSMGRSHHEKVLASATQQLELSVPVKVKVHFHEDIFVIQVPRTTEYEELVERVGKKIRLCGPRRDDGPLRVKYKDEDGDLVSLGSTEDVQMAFESFRPGSQVTLYVQ